MKDREIKKRERESVCKMREEREKKHLRVYCIDNVERMIKYNKFSIVERENKKDIENGERERERGR